MSRDTVKVNVPFTIAGGAQISNVIKNSDLVGATAFSLYATTVPDVHSVVIEGSADDGATWNTWNDGTNDIVAPPAGKVYTYPNFMYTQIRLRDKTAATTGATVFTMILEVPIFGY